MAVWHWSYCCSALAYSSPCLLPCLALEQLSSNFMFDLQAAAWFQHIGFRQTQACPVGFCTAALLGHHCNDEGQQEQLAQLWAIKGSSSMQQQAAMPDNSTMQQPSSVVVDPYQQQQQAGGWDAFAAVDSPLGRTMGQPAADMHGSAAAGGAVAQMGFDATADQSQPPALQLHGGGSPLSGNPFASPSDSLDTAMQQVGTGPNAVLQQGRAVPPLALHKLPMRFGGAELQRSLSPKSRFARSNDAVGLSFTSGSMSFSETTSVGYTTRAASPELGLRQNLLRAMQSPLPPDDPTLAVSNPLFGCTPQRGNSPGKENLNLSWLNAHLMYMLCVCQSRSGVMSSFHCIQAVCNLHSGMSVHTHTYTRLLRSRLCTFSCSKQGAAGVVWCRSAV